MSADEELFDEQIRERLESLVEPVDVDDVLAAVDARSASRSSSGRYILVVAAVVVLVVAAVVGAIRLGGDAARQVTAGPVTVGESTTTPPTSSDVTFTVLWSGVAGAEDMGSLRSATTKAEFGELWSRSVLSSGATAIVPVVDFAEQVVVSITIPDDACPPTLERFERDPTVDSVTIEPIFVEPVGGCREPLIPKTFVVAIDWASTGPRFRLRLPGNSTYGYEDQLLEVAQTPTRPAPVAELTATFELQATTVQAGQTLAGEVVVRNETGAPIHVEGCGSPFWVGLHNDRYAQGQPQLDCNLQSFTLPDGESPWPVEVWTTYTECDGRGGGAGPDCGVDGSPPPLPPGTYQASVKHVEGAPQPPDVTLHVTPGA